MTIIHKNKPMQKNITSPRHVLGISGGKDSAALAIYMHQKYPHLDIEYYCCDTGKELEETYALLDNLEIYLGKKILRLEMAKDSHLEQFDFALQLAGGYLPSSYQRWCTQKLKLEPFEKFVGNDPVISYVGIRGDEDREGYISTKSNIQSIFPYRQNIWSEDVISKVLSNVNIPKIAEYYVQYVADSNSQQALDTALRPLSMEYNRAQKLADLLKIDTKIFNKVVHQFLKTTDYPLSTVDDFSLVDNDDILIRDDIFRILEDSGVGVPAYYKSVEFEVNGKKGQYARSRSGCFFCFFQQNIEWVWLLEQHPDLYEKAMQYEKDGFSWKQGETLTELALPERVTKIKEEYLIRQERINKKKQHKLSQKPMYLIESLEEAEEEGCAACFI
jgi:hypothetical protein